MFMDEMRYGLISNYLRSWSKKGIRTIVPNQLEYESSYLYSAISPIDGESFHLISMDTVNGNRIKIFLEELQKKYKDNHIVLVWDRAPFHKNGIFQKMDNLTSIFLPSYSPELNPIERWFEELRQATANQIFKTIESIEKIIEIDIVKREKNLKAMKQLCGYEWIKTQYKKILKLKTILN